MTEHQQAELLARWLEEGGDPPEGVDVDAIEGTLALGLAAGHARLAPPTPTLSVDELLAGVAEGPFAVGTGPSAAAGMPLNASLGGSPEDAPATGTSARRRPWWIAAVGVGGFGSFVAAAAVLLVVGTVTVQQLPGALPSADQPAPAARPARAAPLEEAVAIAPADTGVQRGDLAKSASKPRPAPRVAAAPRPSPVRQSPAAPPYPRPPTGGVPLRELEPSPVIPEVQQQLAASGRSQGVATGALDEGVAFADEEAPPAEPDPDASALDRASRDAAAGAYAPAVDAELELNTATPGMLDGLGYAEEAKSVAAAGPAPVVSTEVDGDAFDTPDDAATTAESRRATRPRNDPAAPASRGYGAAEKKAEELQKDSMKERRKLDVGRDGANESAPRAEDARTADDDQAEPPAPPPAPPAGSTPSPARPPVTSALAHQGVGSVDHPDVAAVRVILATRGAGEAARAAEQALARHPGNTPVRQELLALQGDAWSQLGDPARAQQLWSAAVDLAGSR